MKETTLDTIAAQTPAVQLARLSGPHGYHFDGDTVHLNAMFALLDPAAHERSWALQLWACPTAPTSAGDLAGHIVAEVALPPMGELADESEHFEVTAFAWPPAGAGDFAMVLVLAAGRSGQFNDIQDLAVYARREQFVQPRMGGNVGYAVEGARVQISVERVENPRAASNRSGSLSLELWALPASFEGGRFQGHHLAGLEIGTLNGQNESTVQPIDLEFAPLPTGTWQMVLMLREWTVDGFVTRDFTEFATPYVVAAPVVEKAPEAVVEAPVTPVVVKAPKLIAVKAAVPETVKTPAAEIAKTVAPIAPPSPAKVVAKAVAKGVSVNTAHVEELAAVKGLTRKLAEGIVKKRPFTSLDELVEVKGLGAKILAKIRSCLRL